MWTCILCYPTHVYVFMQILTKLLRQSALLCACVHPHSLLPSGLAATVEIRAIAYEHTQGTGSLVYLNGNRVYGRRSWKEEGEGLA